MEEKQKQFTEGVEDSQRKAEKFNPLKDGYDS